QRPTVVGSSSSGSGQHRAVKIETSHEEEAPSTLADELKNHASRLRNGDPVGAARAYVELGLLEERVNQDRASARKAYESARGLVRSLEPALTRLRRLYEGRSDLDPLLKLLDDELAAADSDQLKADLLAERARALEALGRLADSRSSYTEA